MKKRKFQTGGDVEEQKRKGLGASAGEKVGFFERLRMGNIDDPTSEAYKRFGAGRGSSEIQKEREAIKEYKGPTNPFQGDDVDPFSGVRNADGNINRSASTNGDKSGVKAAAPATSSAPPPKPATKAKAPIVTKEQMKKAGFDNLRDYLNAQKGLRRRGESSRQPSAQDLDRLEAASYAQGVRADREKYMKERGMKSGGMVKSSASKRADGIAQRGKTKGRIF